MADVHTSTPEPFWRFGSGLLSTSVRSHQQQAVKCAHRTCSHVCLRRGGCRKPVLGALPFDDDVGSFLLQLQKLSNLLLSSRKRHVLVIECHTLCLHSRVSPSHPLALLHANAAPPDQTLVISEHIHMVVFFIYALKTLGDRNKLSLSHVLFSSDTTSTFQRRLDFSSCSWFL